MKVYISNYRRDFFLFHDQIEDAFEKGKIRESTYNILSKINDKCCDIVNYIWGKTYINYVKIDEYDLWNADFTMASIIYPVLLKYKEQKISIPSVENEDVPTELHIDYDAEVSEEILLQRWNHVLNKMIRSFELISLMSDGEFTGEAALKEIEEGTYLFGKYYQTLWI